MNQDCPLYGSEECRLLNMIDCAKCPLSAGENTNGVIERIEAFKRDTEGVDIPALFTGEECKLCRQEPNEKVGYMLYDLGHTMPNKKKEPTWRRILKGGGEEFDILLPLQFNCCASCRKHLWWSRNLVSVTTFGLTALTLIPVSIELTAEKLRAVHRLMPIAVLAAAVLIGYFAGKLLKNKLEKKWSEQTYMKLAEHPVTVKLFEKGWKSALTGTGNKETIMFTKKPLDCGLGTAPAPEAAQPVEAAASSEEEQA